MARRDKDSASLIAADKAAETQSAGALGIGTSTGKMFSDAKPPQMPLTAGKKKSKGKPAFLKGGK